MSKVWSWFPLKDLLVKSEDWIALQPEKMYREITVKLWGKGVVLRREVSGAVIASSKRLRVRANELILSRIDARNGAIGLVPEFLDGAVVSNDFPVFSLRSDRVLPSFISWLTKTHNFIEICKAASEGTTNRVRLQEDRFLGTKISLPPISEQRRIVSRIEELAGKIEEARNLRNQAIEEANRLLICMAHRDDLKEEEKIIAGWHKTPLGRSIHFIDDSCNVSADKKYPNLGIYSFGRGLFHKPPIEGALTNATKLRRVKKGQFIYSRLFAFKGAYGMVSEEYDGHFVSSEYPTFDCDAGSVRAEFLEAYFKSPSVWKEVAIGSKGLGDRRQRVQPSQILDHVIWVPPITLQNRIAKIKSEVNVLNHPQTEVASELDALLPSILDKAFRGKL